MKRWLHQLEVFIDATIPFLLIVLLFVTVIETIFSDSPTVTTMADIYDFIVVSFFLGDLGFKYQRMKHNTPKFVKKYWLEIIASLPIFLMIRIVEFAGSVSSAAEWRRIALQLRDTRSLSATVRSGRTLRFLTSIQDSAIYERAKKFWLRPTGKHYKNEKRKRR